MAAPVAAVPAAAAVTQVAAPSVAAVPAAAAVRFARLAGSLTLKNTLEPR